MNQYTSSADETRTAEVARTLKHLTDQLAILEVEIDDCPHTALRVLNLIVLRGLTPLTIEVKRLADGQRITVNIEPLTDDASAILLAKIEAIVSVRSAAFCTKLSLDDDAGARHSSAPDTTRT